MTLGGRPREEGGHKALKTSLCKEYLSFLLERNLLETIEQENDQGIMYQTTLRGKEALNEFYNLITKFFTPKKK